MSTPELEAKSRPSRRNGINTFEAILAAAGELLAEVGFERLTTNLVCERAGLTPPALYRYFPNKYALLTELTRRLMDAQDQVVFAWIESGGAHWTTLPAAVESHIRLQKEIITVTRAFPGGLWILRAIRALPPLQDVRAQSRTAVLDRVFAFRLEDGPPVDEERLKLSMRVSELMSYTAMEMLVEDPELDEDMVIEEVAWMIGRYHFDLPRRSQLSKA